MEQLINPHEFALSRRIQLGYYPDSTAEFGFYDYYMGDAYFVGGMTAYGKTILAGNIAVELARHRRLLIFDYNGSYKNLKYVNFGNKDNIYRAIPDLVYIHRFGFKLQDFTNPFDWEMMGMTKNGADLCASKARQVLYHKNDFEAFRGMIEEVKVYGRGNKGEAWRATKQSILAKLNAIRNVFVGNDAVDITYADLSSIRYRGVPFYISNWCDFLTAHKHVCLNLNSEYQPAKAQLFAGKILNDIEFVLDKLQPVILVEEAHKLCPEAYDSAVVPYSMFKILHYLKELHKKGTKLILISQAPHQLHEEAMDEIKRFFLGKLQNIRGYSKLDEMFKATLNLNFNVANGYREFLHFSPLYNEKDVFVPFDSLSFYEVRK